MSKLTQSQELAHAEASRLLGLPRALRDVEKWTVLESFLEIADATNSTDGAFFTPVDLALKFAEVVPEEVDSVIDLGAGIGTLSFFLHHMQVASRHAPQRRWVCVEKNPKYVKFGQRLFPEATWICGRIENVPQLCEEHGWGRFDVAISNPPYGRIRDSQPVPGVGKDHFELTTLAVASRVAHAGTFLIPRSTVPLNYDGDGLVVEDAGSAAFRKFAELGVPLRAERIETESDRGGWHGVSPDVVIVNALFPNPGMRITEPEAWGLRTHTSGVGDDLEAVAAGITPLSDSARLGSEPESDRTLTTIEHATGAAANGADAAVDGELAPSTAGAAAGRSSELATVPEPVLSVTFDHSVPGTGEGVIQGALF